MNSKTIRMMPMSWLPSIDIVLNKYVHNSCDKNYVKKTNIKHSHIILLYKIMHIIN